MSDEPVLVLTVVRSGGFTGITRRWRVEATTDADAECWWPLVRACPWDDALDASQQHPDGFCYEVHVNDRAAALAEPDVTNGPWAALVEAVREHGES